MDQGQAPQACSMRECILLEARVLSARPPVQMAETCFSAVDEATPVTQNFGAEIAHQDANKVDGRPTGWNN